MISETEPDTMLIVDKQRNGEGWEKHRPVVRQDEQPVRGRTRREADQVCRAHGGHR